MTLTPTVVEWILLQLGLHVPAEGLHPLLSFQLAFLLSSSLCLGVYLLWLGLLYRPRLDPRDKHCLITGGSKGLGRSLAVLLSQQGAHLTLVARNKKELEEAVASVRQHALTEHQRVAYVQADVTDPLQARKAVEEATSLHGGRCPTWIFCCAGAAQPGLFLDQSVDQFRQGMELNYLGAIHTIQPAVQRMLEQGVTDGRVVLVASVLGLFGLVGYAQYVPTKFALRGLAEVLRQEWKAYSINVHLFCPGTIHTPGYEQEQKMKPEITKEVEGVDPGQSPDEVASALVKGMARNHFIISSEPIGELARCTAQGLAPMNDNVLDRAKALIGSILFPLWRIYVDRYVWGRTMQQNQEKKEPKKMK